MYIDVLYKQMSMYAVYEIVNRARPGCESKVKVRHKIHITIMAVDCAGEVVVSLKLNRREREERERTHIRAAI